MTLILQTESLQERKDTLEVQSPPILCTSPKGVQYQTPVTNPQEGTLNTSDQCILVLELPRKTQ